ncbi:uncharacterized protein LOC111138052 [Crassostrea virginica]
MDLVQFMICSYVNWCGLCSSVRIENASSVSEVDWINCNDTRPYNMTVTNLAFEELYWDSKSCCSGSLRIKYRTDEIPNSHSGRTSNLVTPKWRSPEHSRNIGTMTSKCASDVNVSFIVSVFACVFTFSL